MQQLIQYTSQPVCAQCVLPGSKSLTNRALLLAALAVGESELQGVLVSDDSIACIQALRTLGVEIELDECATIARVRGCGYFSQHAATIHCASAGTVARFLLAACAAFPGCYLFDADEQLRKRPLQELVNILRQQGISFASSEATPMPLEMLVSKGLQGGKIVVDRRDSSQFVSALLMAAPLAQSPVTLMTIQAALNPYIQMTIAMMKAFGVSVQQQGGNAFYVATPQSYQARRYLIETDFSTAAYFFAAAAVTGGSVTVKSLNKKNTLQGDAAFVDVLEQMGCVVQQLDSGLQVQGPVQLQGVEIDMRNFSDTFMTLAAIAPFAATPTVIKNIQHTRLQESDRISAMCDALRCLGAVVEESVDSIKIYPGLLRAGVVKSCHDHRIAMSLAIVGLKVPGIIIDDAECVAKTCPAFFSLWQQLVEDC